MDQVIIDDFKQFIATTVAQHTADLATKADLAAALTAALTVSETNLERRLIKRLDEMQLAIADSITSVNDENDRRFRRLETRAV